MPEIARPHAPPSALLALIVGQICLHACMAGVRMAAPLQALRAGHAEWTVGVLMGLFAAAPIVLALQAGRLADRRGYHHPMRIAVVLTVVGAMLALGSTFAPAAAGFAIQCVAAMLVGAGANIGLIAILRTAGRSASGPVELKQTFAWLGLAPALSNVAGPVLAGTLIDAGGFRLAFGVLAVLPLLALSFARRVPKEAPPPPAAEKAHGSSWDLFNAPGVRRLLLVNWLLSSSWDLHSFLVPILGHERGFSASAIGFVLGAFASAVSAVRVVIPMIAGQLRESTVLSGAMLATAAIFVAYPFAATPWTMGALAVLLGVALGSVQPMVMVTLHALTPHERHGEAIALRSMTINFSSATMPLLFGVAGAALGASVLFWAMAAAVAAGSVPARRVGLRT